MWLGVTDEPSNLYHEVTGSIRLNPRTWAYCDGSRGRGFECAGKRLEDMLPEPYQEGDGIGFFLDVEATTLAIYKNGRLQGACRTLPQGVPLYPFAALDCVQDTVTLRQVGIRSLCTSSCLPRAD